MELTDPPACPALPHSIQTAFDRVELIHDALTALAALRTAATLVTSDRDFDFFQQLEPELTFCSTNS